MKTLNKKGFTYSMVNKFTSKNKKISSITYNKSIFLILLSFLLIAQYGICQQFTKAKKSGFGLAISSMINVDGYGTQYLPAAYYKKNRSYFFAGPTVQKEKLNVSGVQFNYEYSLVKEDDSYTKRLELFCFATALYQHNATLGKQTLRDESIANPEYTGNISQMNFKAVEVYGGFGLRIKLFKSLKWINSIGGGGYSCFNFPQHLYYANHNMGLYFKTGISFDLKTN